MSILDIIKTRRSTRKYKQTPIPEDVFFRVMEAARRAPHRDWIVDEKRMSASRDNAGIFLHCLPVRRNVVVTDGVLDGSWSRVTDQAENRLHAQRAVLETMMTDGGGN